MKTQAGPGLLRRDGCVQVASMSIKPVLNLFLVFSMEPKPLFIRDRNKDYYL